LIKICPEATGELLGAYALGVLTSLIVDSVVSCKLVLLSVLRRIAAHVSEFDLLVEIVTAFVFYSYCCLEGVDY
jgi:hypothetical protein